MFSINLSRVCTCCSWKVSVWWKRIFLVASLLTCAPNTLCVVFMCMEKGLLWCLSLQPCKSLITVLLLDTMLYAVPKQWECEWSGSLLGPTDFSVYCFVLLFGLFVFSCICFIFKDVCLGIINCFQPVLRENPPHLCKVKVWSNSSNAF